MTFDSSINKAQKDIQTTLPNGQRTEKFISGVSINGPVTHVDHRGRLFEIWSGNQHFWKDPVVYCYMFSIKKNCAKGWGLHLEKDDRYTLIKGECCTVLYDPRRNSSTFGMTQKIFLSEQGVRQLVIPKGVWHVNLNVSEEETFLINNPTQIYNHEAPDRYQLPLDTDEIPFKISDLFPAQIN